MPGSGTSALIIAITNGNFELAALLLDRGADPNADAQGWSALHQVAFTRRPPNVKGLPPPVPSGNLDTLALAKALIAHGADPNGRMKKEPGDGHRTYMISRIGATPFLNAARGTDVDLMRVLKEGGANPSLTTDEGTTPLMIAAGVGIWKTGESAGTNEEALQAVKLAWELGNDVNVVDKRGNTAMHGAALRGSPEIVRFLVSKGAKTDVTNKIGWTPLTIAEGVLYPNTFSRSFETAAALRELGAKDAGKRRPEDMPPSEVFSEATKAAQQPK
jgi:ankyrin repeat protein